MEPIEVAQTLSEFHYGWAFFSLLSLWLFTFFLWLILLYFLLCFLCPQFLLEYVLHFSQELVLSDGSWFWRSSEPAESFAPFARSPARRCPSLYIYSCSGERAPHLLPSESSWKCRGSLLPLIPSSLATAWLVAGLSQATSWVCFSLLGDTFWDDISWFLRYMLWSMIHP